MLCLSVGAFAQELSSTSTRGTLYFTWGYHRDTYTKSNIHFKDSQTDDYDFKFYNAKAHDRADMHSLFSTPLTIPQYVINVGYIFKDRKGWGFEFSWDHLKYIVNDNQMMHMTGMIHENLYNKDTLVTPGFVHFEHTNGNNYMMASAVRQLTLIKSVNGNHQLNTLFKAGGGILYPKTDSYIMGKHNDGPFQFSGYVIGVSANLRYVIYKYFYLEGSLKGSFADYTHAKLYEKGYAQQTFFSLQAIGSAGISIPL
ncbi:MAG: hypothetical protein WDO14_08035 [Bacteroidota bacterium]